MALLLQERLVDPSTLETQPLFGNADGGARASDEEAEVTTAKGQKRKVVKGTFQASRYIYI